MDGTEGITNGPMARDDTSQHQSFASRAFGMTSDDYFPTSTAGAHSGFDVKATQKLRDRLNHIKATLDSYRAKTKVNLGNEPRAQCQLRLFNEAFDAFDVLLDVPNHGRHCVYVNSRIPYKRKTSLNGYTRRNAGVKDGASGELVYDCYVHRGKTTLVQDTEDILSELSHLDDESNEFATALLDFMDGVFWELLRYRVKNSSYILLEGENFTRRMMMAVLRGLDNVRWLVARQDWIGPIQR